MEPRHVTGPDLGWRVRLQGLRHQRLQPDPHERAGLRRLRRHPHPPHRGRGPEPTRQRPAAPFSHATEVASPGNYAVTVGRPAGARRAGGDDESGTRPVQLPGTEPTPTSCSRWPTARRGRSRSAVTVVGDREVDGSVVSGDFCGTAGHYHLYFAARFDTPFQHLRDLARQEGGPGVADEHEGAVGRVRGLRERDTRAVEMQVGVSFVSVADARAQHRRRAARVGTSARCAERDTATWNAAAGPGPGERGAASRTSAPSTPSSITRCCTPTSSTTPTATTSASTARCTWPSGYTQYANFSGWDVYRSEVQLLALLAPAQTERHGHVPAGRRRPGRGTAQVARGQRRERPAQRGLRRRLHRVGVRLRGPELRRPRRAGRHGQGGDRPRRQERRVTSNARTWPSTWPRGTSRPTRST